jgi:hypothetical protein
MGDFRVLPFIMSPRVDLGMGGAVTVTSGLSGAVSAGEPTIVKVAKLATPAIIEATIPATVKVASSALGGIAKQTVSIAASVASVEVTKHAVNPTLDVDYLQMLNNALNQAKVGIDYLMPNFGLKGKIIIASVLAFAGYCVWNRLVGNGVRVYNDNTNRVEVHIHAGENARIVTSPDGKRIDIMTSLPMLGQSRTKKAKRSVIKV